jgi:hypothetical protein
LLRDREVWNYLVQRTKTHVGRRRRRKDDDNGSGGGDDIMQLL